MRELELLVDTNLLVLFLIGLYDQKLMRSNKRTSSYSIEDFEYVQTYIANASKVYVTPSILTEVSNLTDRIGEKNEPFFDVFKKVFSSKKQFEIYIPKEKILGYHFLRYVGVADASLYLVAVETKCQVLTDDERCAPYLIADGCRVLTLDALKKYMNDSKKMPSIIF